MNEYIILEHLKGNDNIVNMEAAIEGRYHVYFIMDHCSGGDILESIIEHFDTKGVYTEMDAARIMKDMLTAVKVCHDHGVVHRDIKPENFLWQGKGADAILKLTDFGLSQIMDGTPMKSSCGTPNYMPPEMWMNEEYTENVDVWSLGVSLALMVTGVFPFDGDDEQTLAQEIVYKELNWQQTPYVILSEACSDLLQKMLQKDPEKRISVKECLEHPWLNGAARDVSLDSQVKKGISTLVNSTKFQRAVLRLLVVLASDDEVAAMVKSFQQMDKNHDGKVNFSEMMSWLNNKTFEANEQECKELFAQMDEDADGSLNLEEYVVMAMGLRTSNKKVEALTLFEGLDRDKDGYISKQEAKGVFEAAGLTGEYFWSKADLNQDGKISLEEFEMFLSEHLGGPDGKFVAVTEIPRGSLDVEIPKNNRPAPTPPEEKKE